MMTLKFNGHTIEVYDSLQELPITRFQMYNLNLLIDGGIGSDLNAFNQHIHNVSRLMSRDQEAAQRELINLQQNVQFIMSKTSPEMNAFVVMIRKINDREITDDDLTDEGIKKIIADLGKKRLTVLQMKDVLKAIKKKLDQEFDTFFPNLTDSATVKEFYSKLRHRTSLILKSIRMTSKEIEQQIADIDEFFFSRIKPKQYHGREGLEVNMIKGFEETCILLTQYRAADDPKKMTTLAFYQALDVIKQQLKQRKKQK